MFKNRPVPYNPEWPSFFEKIKTQIESVFDPAILKLHHIGSTAIPGMLAKPIIDMLGEINDSKKVDQLAKNLAEIGFEFKGEFGIPDRAYFPRTTQIKAHLHVFPQGHFQIKKHLLFRDYLIMFQPEADRYKAKKLELLEQFPDDKQAYQDGKNDLVAQLTKIATEVLESRIVRK